MLKDRKGVVVAAQAPMVNILLVTSTLTCGPPACAMRSMSSVVPTCDSASGHQLVSDGCANTPPNGSAGHRQIGFIHASATLDEHIDNALVASARDMQGSASVNCSMMD